MRTLLSILFLSLNLLAQFPPLPLGLTPRHEIQPPGPRLTDPTGVVEVLEPRACGNCKTYIDGKEPGAVMFNKTVKLQTSGTEIKLLLTFAAGTCVRWETGGPCNSFFPCLMLTSVHVQTKAAVTVFWDGKQIANLPAGGGDFWFPTDLKVRGSGDYAVIPCGSHRMLRFDSGTDSTGNITFQCGTCPAN